MKLGKTFATAVSFIIGLAFPAMAQVVYSVTDLGAGDAYALNNSGQVVGQNSAGDVFLYSGGTMTDLGAGAAYGINNSGQVVGQNSAGDAFLYSGGTMTDLGAGAAYGINNSGQVVGQNVQNGYYGDAFLYSAGTMTDVGTAVGGVYSQAKSINNKGDIAGLVGFNNGQQPFLYQNGSVTHPPLLSLPPVGVNAIKNNVIKPALPAPLFMLGGANSINDNGQIVGWQEFTETYYYSHAFLYSGGAMIDLGVLPGTDWSMANGINNNGQIVGFSQEEKGGPLAPHAFLYNGGAMTDLNSLIDSMSGWTLNEANAINDSGWIVGQGTNPFGQTDAFLLIPVPEPDSVLFAGLGLLGLVFVRRHQR